MALTPAEKRLATALDFDEGICELVKDHCGGPLARMTVFANKSEAKEVDAVTLAVSRKQVVPIICKLQPHLLPHGYRAFWTDMYEKGSKRSEVVAVLKTGDASEIIRLQRTSGGNYGVSTDAILEKLDNWRGQCELDVIGAGSAWVAIQFTTLPREICAFAEEIYDFCPDAVEQGVGLQNEKDNPKKFDAARRLCPTLSKRMERKLEEQKARFATMQLPPELRARMELSGFTTPTDMGIRLLAYELNDARQLFLWWD
jgi:hypothetical protein